MRLMVRLKMRVSPFRLDEIFSKCKTEGGEELNFNEFKAAFNFIQDKYNTDALYMFGRSTTQLIISFSVMGLIFLVLIVFVLVGISAFSNGGVFNTMVNSLLPVLAAFGLDPKIDNGNEDQFLEDKDDQNNPIMQALKIFDGGEAENEDD